jgi:hypothetical protein
MTPCRIALLGDDVETWLYAALLSQLSRGSTAITVVPTARKRDRVEIALPPDIERVHALLRIAPQTIMALGRPRYGIHINRPGGGPIFIPYGRLGDPDMPGDFRDLWIRARFFGEAGSWEDYSSTIRLLTGGNPKLAQDSRVRRGIIAGWDMAVEPYLALVKDAALARGVRRSAAFIGQVSSGRSIGTIRLADGTALEADIFVTMGPDCPQEMAHGSDGWRDNLVMAGASDLEASQTEPFGIASILSSAARLVRLLPRSPSRLSGLAGEYNRILKVERAAMEAAAAVLQRLAGRSSACQTLDGYVERYRVAGLLPQDPQPWSRDIWLVCLDSLGLNPVRYDPNIDRIPRADAQAQLTRWRDIIRST